MVIYLITDLLEFFNLVRMMNINQIKQTTDLIFECYPNFKIDDFVLCFKNIKLKKYIKMYEGIDGSKILECLEMYDIEKENEIIEFRKKESELYKKQPIEFNPILKEVLNKFVETEKKEIPKLERTVIQLQFDKYIIEFEKKCSDDAIRLIDYNGKKLMIDQYCNLRFEEEK